MKENLPTPNPEAAKVEKPQRAILLKTVKITTDLVKAAICFYFAKEVGENVPVGAVFPGIVGVTNLASASMEVATREGGELDDPNSFMRPANGLMNLLIAAGATDAAINQVVEMNYAKEILVTAGVLSLASINGAIKTTVVTAQFVYLIVTGKA